MNNCGLGEELTYKMVHMLISVLYFLEVEWSC